MTLTGAELKLVRRIEQSQRTWKWARWIVLLLGIVMIALAAFFLRAVWQEMKQEQLLLMFVAVVAPVCSLFLLAGVLCVAYVASCWRGRAAERLLLRLLEKD